MRRDSEPQRDLVAPGRFTGFGILALSVALGAFVFFAVGPMVENNAHLDAIEDLDDRERLERGLRTLCNTQQNLKLLNQQLAEKTRADRNRVTPVAKELGCLTKLDPRFQAEHHLWMGEERDAVDGAVAQGDAALEPAIDALEASAEDDEGKAKAQIVRERAMRALVALSAKLLNDHKTRIDKRLTDKDTSPEAHALRAALGFEHPHAPKTPEHDPGDHAHEADAGHGDSHSADMGHDSADADMDNADMDDVNLGSGSFRLKLDGLGAPPRRPRPTPGANGFKLREPSLEKPSGTGSVLFKKEQPGLGVSEEINAQPGADANATP